MVGDFPFGQSHLRHHSISLLCPECHYTTCLYISPRTLHWLFKPPQRSLHLHAQLQMCLHLIAPPQTSLCLSALPWMSVCLPASWRTSLLLLNSLCMSLSPNATQSTSLCRELLSSFWFVDGIASPLGLHLGLHSPFICSLFMLSEFSDIQYLVAGCNCEASQLVVVCEHRFWEENFKKIFPLTTSCYTCVSDLQTISTP